MTSKMVMVAALLAVGSLALAPIVDNNVWTVSMVYSW